jgi:hypothetical protein
MIKNQLTKELIAAWLSGTSNKNFKYNPAPTTANEIKRNIWLI